MTAGSAVLQNLPMYSFSHFRKPLQHPHIYSSVSSLCSCSLSSQGHPSQGPHPGLGISESRAQGSPFLLHALPTIFTRPQLSWESGNQDSSSWETRTVLSRHPHCLSSSLLCLSPSQQLLHRSMVREVTETPAYKDFRVEHWSGA